MDLISGSSVKDGAFWCIVSFSSQFFGIAISFVFLFGAFVAFIHFFLGW